MREKALLTPKLKTKYKRKTVIKDQDLSVVIHIPISSDTEYREEEALQTSVEEAISEEKRILELHLVRPLVHTPKDVVPSIDRNIIIPLQVTPFNYVFLIKYIPKRLTKVSSLDIERNIHPTLTTISNTIEEIQKNVPVVDFEDPELINTYSIEKSINVEVKPSSNALNYIMNPRLVFRQPYSIKHKDIDKEITVKTSELIGAADSTKAMGKEVSIEQEDVIEYFLKTMLPLSKMVMDRPFLILAEKPQNKMFDYIELLKRLLRELYRVYVGGLPSPTDLRTDFEEVKLDVRAGKHIYVIDVDEVFGEEAKDKEYVKYVIDRLRELYSQSLGFLVLYGSKNILEKIKEILWSKYVSIDFPKIKFLGKIQQPIEISVQEDHKIYKLVNLLWGRVLNFEEVSENIDLDSYSVMLEDEFYRKIRDLALSPETVIKVEPSKRDEEGLGGESLLHYGIKAFAVKYLIEHEEIPEYNVFTEHEVGDIIVDVFTKHPVHGDLAIEVETLYGTVLPLLKLRKTIESRLSKGLKLWIIIPNPQFMLFIRDIARLRSIYRKKYLDSIEFFVLDVYSKKLVPFSEFVKRVKTLLEKGISNKQLDLTDLKKLT